MTKYVISFFKGGYQVSSFSFILLQVDDVANNIKQVKDVDQKIDFSSIKDMSAYVPQIKLKSFSFPFLACDIDGVDEVSHHQRVHLGLTCVPQRHFSLEFDWLERSVQKLRLLQFDV